IKLIQDSVIIMPFQLSNALPIGISIRDSHCDGLVYSQHNYISTRADHQESGNTTLMSSNCATMSLWECEAFGLFRLHNEVSGNLDEPPESPREPACLLPANKA